MAALFYDLASPYAYLAVERAARVLGTEPVLEPVALGAIFRVRGFGSWAHTERREQEMAEVERRAAANGLPPVTWPPGWPANSLHAHRAVVWAERHGRGPDLAHAAYRAAFQRGADLVDHAVLRALVSDLGLSPDEMEAAIAEPALKDAFKRRTEAAIALGVRGVPTLQVGDALLFGDDQLERAAQAPMR